MGKEGLVPQKLARSRQCDRKHWTICAGGRLEGSQLKRPDPDLRGEGAFGEYEYRFPLPQGLLDFGSLPEAGLRIAAIKRKVVELAKEGADERHTVNFVLGDEMIVHAQGRHQH